MTGKVNQKRMRRRRPVVTMSDVARHAGVTAMTVSRALKEPERLAAPTRERVLSTIRQLGYIPNLMAGGLASAQTWMVAVVVPTLRNIVFASIAEALEIELRAAGYQVLLAADGYDPEEEERIISRVLGWAPDGVVLAGVQHTEATRGMLKAAATPVVEIFDLATEPIDLNVGVSHKSAGVDLTRTLLELGYKRIGFIGALMEHDPRAAARCEGWREAMSEAGLSAHVSVDVGRQGSLQAGAEGLDIALKRDPMLQAAIFSADMLAVGGLLECDRRGVSVPEEFGIAGMGGGEIAGEFKEGITSVRFPSDEIGVAAAELLLRRLRGEPLKARSVVLDFEIIRRGSTR